MPVLEFDPAVMRERFSETPFRIRHKLADHPLLQLERLGQLADSLPDSQVEHNLGSVPEVLPGGEAPRLDASPGEIARGIESNGCWMVLKRVESDPEYRSLLEETLDEVIPLVADRQGGATKKEAFIFLSAPNSVTPLHTDPEQNLLLQVKASKEIDIGTWSDEGAEAAHLERYYGGGHRNVDEMPANAETFLLEPGDGVHVPLNCPHVVRNLEQPSISFSITFNTEYSEQLADVYSTNAKLLRKMRLTPTPPGRSAGRDRAKAAVWRTLRRGKRGVQRLRGGGAA